MNKQEKINYIANLIAIASADGKVTADEGVAVRSIMADLGLDQADLVHAKREVSSGKFKFKFFSKPADQMRNVEDMVVVALADGHLDDSESKPIEKISDIMKLTQMEMDMLVKRAQSRVKKGFNQKRERKKSWREKPQPAPPPVPAETPASHGRMNKRSEVPKAPVAPPPAPLPVPAETEPVQPAGPPEKGIVIIFRDVITNSCTDLIEESSNVPQAGKYRIKNVKMCYAAWPMERMDDAAGFAFMAADQPGVAVLIDGKKFDFDDVFCFIRCAKSREDSGKQDEYCHGCTDESINTWGCRLLEMPWSESADWFRLGTVREGRKYHFDKEAIRIRLEKTGRRVSLCPYFRPDIIAAALDRMQTKVNIWGKWKFREAGDDTPGAVLMEIKESLHGCSFDKQAYVDAVVPTNNLDAIRIIRLARKDCGLAKLDYAHLQRMESFLSFM